MVPHPRPAPALAAWALCLALSLSPLLHPAARAAESLALLDEVGREVRETFYDTGALPAFAERVAETHAALGENPSPEAVARAIDALLASLRASHTARYTPNEVEYYEVLDIFAGGPLGRRIAALFPGGEVAYTGIGVRAEEVDGKIFLSDVYDGGPADRAGLRRGNEIVSADGRPFHPIRSFAGRDGGTVTLEVRRRAGGPVEEVKVTPKRIRPGDLFLSALRDSARTIERGGCRIGYAHVWSYAGERYHGALVRELARGRLRDADALVLDLRGGWGGADPNYAELFVGRAPETVILGRDGEETLAAFHWRRPTVVLVDEESRSGKEILAFGLQREGVPLVGARTAGAVLAGRAHVLSDGSFLYVASNDVRVEGERLEGRGVTPDVAVERPLVYAADRDPQLDAALAEAVRLLEQRQGC